MMNTLVLILGALTGYIMERLSLLLIRKRISGPIVNRFSGGVLHTFGWMVSNAICWLFLFILGGLNIYTVECAIVISACMVLSAVDISIKKIPNELLLAILLIHIVAIFSNRQFNNIYLSFFGFVFGIIIFLIPFSIGKGAGLGDVKFAAIVGFILGVYGLLASVMIMTLFLAIYTSYLVLSHKGGLKTKLALGPFIASGVAVVMVLNIVNGQNIFYIVTNFI